METKEFIVTEEKQNIRCDKFLSDELEDFSRESLKKLFKEGEVFLNDEKVKPSRKLLVGERVKVNLPEPEVLDVIAENIPINIVYEDEDVVIVDKPQGMVVHPANGNYSGTLVNALMYHVKDLSSINGVIRPGIVHRIDKDTSGLLIVAKNDNAHNHLAAQFKEHSINRRYKTICHGIIHENLGTIDAPIGRDKIKRKDMCVTQSNSKRAVTHFDVIERYDEYTFLDVHLETGRTHQIRVHLKYISHPVVGDKVYGFNKEIDKPFKGQLLHAYKLGFIHPRTSEYMEFNSELPDYFYELLDK
ncbi:RluA family pseudouridine synthase [uncultured Anaerofustis sp.]|uniref:RluA family pseudouridine synthase n=1 Tax=uncultured Anaerofustis sp. TaxID=904996 RepID=UPI0025ED74B9|nr:RluA family pseudouridine synthase [uncultured Anaerofustis sp.]